MLELIRKRSQSIFIQIVVLLIAIVFIFWGVGTRMMNKRSAIAVVNGVEISIQDYRDSYERMVDNYQRQFGGTIPKGLLEKIGIKKQVLAKLIRSELLRQGAKKMGVTIGKLAAQEKIQEMEAFKQDGIFNMERYKRVLSQNRLTPKSFEATLVNDLINERTTSLIYEFAPVSEGEIESQLQYDNEKIQLRYAALRPEDYLNKVEVDEKKLVAWYEKHKVDYKSEPEIRLDYLLFNYDDFDVGNLKEEELVARYEKEKYLYERPEERHARHMLFRVDDIKDIKLKKEKKAKALEVLKRARQGEDFIQLAKTYSEGPTGSNGGDLGFFKRGEMVSSFDKVVFAMKPGDISDLVESPFGYHIIKLEEVQPAMTRPFSSVRNEIATIMKKEKARGLAFQRASKAYEDIIRAGSLEKYSALGKETVHKSEYFQRNDPPSTISSDPKFRESIQNLKKGELSLLVELENGYAILFIEDIKESVIPELKVVRERVVKDYKKEQSVELARTAAENLLSKAREKGDLAKVAQLAGIATNDSAVLSRIESMKSITPPPQVFQDGYKRTWSDPFPNAVISEGDIFYLYEIIKTNIEDQTIGSEPQEQLQQQLAVATQNKLLTNWLSHLEGMAKIWINDEMLK